VRRAGLRARDFHRQFAANAAILLPERKFRRRSIVSVMNVALKGHKFSVGQTVHYTGPFGRSGVSGSFRVVKLLPLEGDEFRYRIKSAGEAFERVARESQLDRDH
jgi:hypothetical protein